MGLGLVVGVAADAVDLGERELELVHQALCHLHQARLPGELHQGDVEGEVPLVELVVGRLPLRTAECRHRATLPDPLRAADAVGQSRTPAPSSTQRAAQTSRTEAARGSRR